MSTITIARATVEQALEALRLAYEGRCRLDTVPDAMDALRGEGELT